MKTDSSEDCYYSQQEAAALLDALIRSTGQEYTQIIYAAHWLALRADDEPSDLFQEACCRVLELKRKWPTSLEVVPFMIGVMKSIVSHRRNHAGPKLDRGSSEDELVSIVSPSPATEKIIEDRAELKHVLKQLESDPELHALACARANEETPDERLARFNGDAKKLAAAERRLRRKLLSLKS